MKISDNNIENIFNINIYINGVFSNNIEQDIITVIVGLLNQQSVNADGLTLKDQLLQLANKAKTKDIDINVPSSAIGQSLNFDGLASKIQGALVNKGESDPTALLPSNLQDKAKELLSQYMAGRDVSL
jgi:hypothetical protein